MAEKKENFSAWVRAMLFSEDERYFSNGVAKIDRKKFVCSECGSWIKSTDGRIHGAPHATTFLGKFHDDACRGTMERVE